MTARAAADRHSLTAAAIAGALALALAGPGVASAKAYTIVIAHLAYGPAPNGLRVGDTIAWVNQDMFRHTVTARDGGFDHDLPPKAKVLTRLQRPGVVDVYCRYHPGMSVKLTVAK